MTDQSYTVTMCPPAYPGKLRPFTCRHAPQHHMMASMTLDQKRGCKWNVQHLVCLACGAPLPCTVGGNVLVDLRYLFAEFGWHPKLHDRIVQLRGRYARLAWRLFDANGWNGRHERWARLIDPNLTMKLALAGEHADGTRMVMCRYDPEFEDDPFPPDGPAEAAAGNSTPPPGGAGRGKPDQMELF